MYLVDMMKFRRVRGGTRYLSLITVWTLDFITVFKLSSSDGKRQTLRTVNGGKDYAYFKTYNGLDFYKYSEGGDPQCRFLDITIPTLPIEVENYKNYKEEFEILKKNLEEKLCIVGDWEDN